MSNHLRWLQSAAPSSSPGVEQVRTGGFKPRFDLLILNSLPGRLFVRRHVCDAITDSDCASVPGQAQIRSCKHHRNHRAATAVRLSEVDASGDALSAPIHCLTRAASTLGMGRRIMADRRRSRTRRGPRHWARARPTNDGRSVNGPDASLRAFVHALARQVARECFELELKRQPRSIQ